MKISEYAVQNARVCFETPIEFIKKKKGFNFLNFILMELASILEVKSSFYILLLLLLPLVVLLVFVKAKQRQSSSSKWQNLPPGPVKWPILGNLLSFIGRKPHLVVTKMARVYGPLISLKLGNQRVVIACSPTAASEILKTHDRELCGRYAPKATPIKESDLKKISLLWAEDCGNQWKSTRVLWKSELFSNKAMELMGGMREQKVAEMVEFLGAKGKEGKVVNIGDVVFTTLFRTLGMLCFSQNLISFKDEKIVRELKSNIWKFMEHSTTPILADFFPAFDGIFDPQFQKKRAVNCLNKLLKVWQGVVKERRRGAHNSAADFLDFMLSNNFSDIQIDYMLLVCMFKGFCTLKLCTEKEYIVNNFECYYYRK